ncbi:MAG: YdcF family protein [Eubacteriales bacterium]|nr:YdcF family protein [Eubacteriales bacterium]
MNKAELINVLGNFCGKRDIPDLNQECLQEAYGIKKTDVFVLFGGSILEGGNVLAEAMKAGIAETYIIVGGAGHTTDTLREIVRKNTSGIDTADLTEAEMFHEYIKELYGIQADYLECHSTNCGNNITLLLDLMEKNQIKCDSIMLAQDATMQYRMEATLKKYVSGEVLLINYATYQVQVLESDAGLVFDKQPLGMWDMDRYITLLMGEIPRLRDDENGYGPRGKNFISHVDIPQEVNDAFEELKKRYSESVREANPRFASRRNLELT